MDIEIGVFFRVFFFVLGVATAAHLSWTGFKVIQRQIRLGQACIEIGEEDAKRERGLRPIG